jgi:MYXO-CTERM domain-containing protein
MERGHWDCDNGYECVDDDDGDDTGTCEQVPENADKSGTGALCDGSNDCAGGLCHNGVCTKPCDFDCSTIGGYECDATAIPGGLCKAVSCADDESICDENFTCEYSSAGRYVCAVGANSGPCSCTASGPSGDGEGSEPTYALLLFGALATLLGRRRRERR